MTADRWQRIEEIFQSALDQSPAERSAWISKACEGDENLRAEVESLLAHEEAAPGNIEALVSDAQDTFERDVQSADIGKRIGPYEIVREIGRGGMGSVYMAIRADEQYLQAVALKLVRRGMDSQFILNRFRYERQILANLSHPNIAAILDGGTTDDGRPYFVMEYVEGEPLVDYCQNRELTIAQRLEMFRAVCSAVHHAHQKLVIHRDIKPGNILVTASGVPKLLDFGIAKLLATGQLPGLRPVTQTVVRLMTPDYASPEQVRGDEITTATDVYSLGALLYELLTGARPYDFVDRSTHGIEQAICTEDPSRPSDVASLDERTRKKLRGDLDNIIMMAMRKEPGRRYSSVAQFSEDIQNYLSGLPVLARGATLRYRLGKIVQRNKVAVFASLVVLVTLFGGLMATLWQARVAERRFNELRKLANSFLFEFHDAIQNLPGSTPARALVVRKALEYLDNLSREASSDESLLRELATAYLKVGDVQGNVFHSNLGDTAGALESYRKAVAIREELARKHPGVADFERELAASYRSLGDIYFTRGEYTRARDVFSKSLAIAGPLYNSDPSNPERLQLFADLYNRMGDIQANTNETREALESYTKVMRAYERWYSRESANKRARRGVAVAYLRVGDMMARTGDRQGALAIYLKSLDLRKAAAEAEPSNATLRRDLLTAYNRIGDLTGNPYTQNLGDLASAHEYYSRSLQIARELFTADPHNARAAYDLAITYMRIGDLMRETGTPAARLQMYLDGIAISQAAMRSDPENVETKYNIVLLKHRAGLVYSSEKRYSEALREMQEALRLIEPLARQDRQSGRFLYELGSLRGAMGEVRLALGNLNEALSDFAAHVKWLEAAGGDAFVKNRKALASAYSDMAEVNSLMAKRAAPAARQAHLEATRSWAAKSLALWADLKRENLVGDKDLTEVAEAQTVAALAEKSLRRIVR